ncbi:MAG: formate dehydrogenase subunit gamma [Deltaproteobacteria bacterium]|nr:formate dehydrogenase subunit gamma [Deltaproteobacteria bacterium]
MSNQAKSSPYELIEVTNAFERLIHWLFAGSCILLFISGFGLMFHSLSVIASLFGGYYPLKYVHNFSGLVFAVSGFFAVIIWFKDGAIFTADDMKWISTGGGYLWTKEGVPESGRFNAGQKAYFILKAVTWILMSATGIVMWFPFSFSRDLVITCYPLHALGVATLAGAVVIHIFLGSCGNPGTIQSMLSGKCTRAWAKLQHAKWLKEQDRNRR